ncbi:MAG: CPBP family glutamic-type intramembrane protease [Bryobacteraceae bacterium]
MHPPLAAAKSPWPSYLAALVTGWIALSAAGVYYARLKGISLSLAGPVIVAFLLEYAFYLVPGFPALLDRLSRGLRPARLAFLLTASAMLPYLVYSLATGQFQAIAAARLLALVACISYWYVVREPGVTADLAMLALIASVIIFKFFRSIYVFPIPRLGVDVLGQVMLIRLSAIVFLVFRDMDDTGFGFIPTAREWKIGLRYFLYFLPLGLSAAYAMGALRFAPSWTEVWRAPLVFAGFLWVRALSEEFLARGLLQRWLTDWTGRPTLALAIASVIFGLSHLGFRQYPNWKWVVVSSLLGWFCGKAYQEAGGIRASMVTHTLVVVVWQTLFV